jgi:F5/8 type C domain
MKKAIQPLIVIIMILAGTITGCIPPAPPYPHEPPDKVLRDAQVISDNLEAYIKKWLDGQVPAQVPASLIPKGIVDSKDFYLKHPDSATAEETWASRIAQPINFDSCHNGLPDPNVSYLLLGPGLAPFGSKMVIEGEFPYCRFFSLQVSHPLDGKNYTATRYFGSAEVSWADADIDPLPGHTNPFRPGANRLATNRKYRVEINMAKGDPVALNGEAFKPPYRQQGNTRFGSLLVYQGPWGEQDFFGNPKSDGGKWNLGALWVRIYAPDKNKNVLGGVAMPKVWFELPDGRKYFLGADFSMLKKNANATMPARVTHTEPNKNFGPETGWFKSWGIVRSILNGAAIANGWSRTGNFDQINAVDRGVTGRGENMPAPGNYEPHATTNNYATYLGRSATVQKGYVAVLVGKMPVFPDTRNGAPLMQKGQVRYWSLCGYDNDIAAKLPGSVINGIMDDEVTLDRERNYIIALSRPEDKPQNAKTANGVSWVNWGPTSELGLMMRFVTVAGEWDFPLSPHEQHLSWANSDWTGSRYDSTLIGVNSHKGFMQCYLPRIRIMKREDFEALGNGFDITDIPVWIDNSNRIGVSEAQRQLSFASSVWNNEPQYLPSRAFDGDLSTRWSSKWGERNASLHVDLGTVKKISGVKLFWESAAAKVYTIDVSADGVTWNTVYTDTRGNGGIDVINNLKAVGRYVRMRATRSWWGSYSLYEMEVYSPDIPCSYSPGTFKTNDKATLSIFPNPVTDHAQIDLRAVLAGAALPYRVQLSNASGQRVMEATGTTASFPLSLKGLQKGTYWVQVWCNERQYRSPLVKW